MEGRTRVLSPCHQGRCPPPSFEVKDALEEVEAVGPDATLAITSSKEPAEERGPSRVAEMDGGQNPDAP